MNVVIDEPATMNVLGLFLAQGLTRNLVARGRRLKLVGALIVDADGMRATAVFSNDSVTVTRTDEAPGTVISAPLAVLVQALVRPRLRTLLKVKVRGSRLFALRAMRYFAP